MSSLLTELREQLADLCHQQWSGWMEYLFSKGTMNEDGSCTIPAEYVQRWQRQMDSFYDQLPEDEKESDRKEADRFIEFFGIDFFLGAKWRKIRTKDSDNR